LSVAFGQAEWDLLPILPCVTAPVASAQLHRLELARRIIAGGDVEAVDRQPGDVRPASQIVKEWIRGRASRR